MRVKLFGLTPWACTLGLALSLTLFGCPAKEDTDGGTDGGEDGGSEGTSDGLQNCLANEVACTTNMNCITKCENGRNFECKASVCTEKPEQVNAHAGDTCTADAECAAGGDAGVCVTDQGFTDGYCYTHYGPAVTDPCDASANELYVSANGTDYFCIKGCSAAGDCRSGYGCWQFGTAASKLAICYPDCTVTNFQCSDDNSLSCDETMKGCRSTCNGNHVECGVGAICDQDNWCAEATCSASSECTTYTVTAGTMVCQDALDVCVPPEGTAAVGSSGCDAYSADVAKRCVAAAMCIQMDDATPPAMKCLTVCGYTDGAYPQTFAGCPDGNMCLGVEGSGGGTCIANTGSGAVGATCTGTIDASSCSPGMICVDIGDGQQCYAGCDASVACAAGDCYQLQYSTGDNTGWAVCIVQ